MTKKKKSRYWFIWKVSCLPHEYACTSQRDFEEWTQNIRYLHNRIAVSKAKIKAAEVSGLTPKEAKKAKQQKQIDPVLLEELKSLDPFAPGKTKEEKEHIWARINQIRDLIGEDALGGDDDEDNDGVKTESISTSSEGSDEDDGDGDGDDNREERGGSTSPTTKVGLDINAIKRAASSTSKMVASKTKVVAERTKEKSDILSSRTAVSARALKNSMGHVTKNVVNKVKGDT